MDVIKELETCYKTKDTVAKQRIVTSLYPEKLVFEKSGYRTPKTLNVISLINRYDGGFEGNKKGKNRKICNSSLQVESTDKKPNHLIKDIELLYGLKAYIPID